MSVDLVIPSMGESVKTAIVAKWLKKPGDTVRVDEGVATIDSDKATAELPSPVSGVIEALLVAEGDSVPGPILEIGNTNSRYRFACGGREFVNRWNRQGPAHHCAVGVGHIAERIEKLGALLGLETIRVV